MNRMWLSSQSLIYLSHKWFLINILIEERLIFWITNNDPMTPAFFILEDGVLSF